MKAIAVLLAVGTLATFTVAGVRAAEQAFECPRVSPVDGQTPLAFIRILHDGSASWGRPDVDEERRTGRIVRWRNDWFSYRFFDGKMNCEYGWNRRPPLHIVTIDMPGLLLRCEGEYLDPPPSRDRLDGRQWCTTRIDGAPRR